MTSTKTMEPLAADSMHPLSATVPLTTTAAAALKEMQEQDLAFLRAGVT